MPHPATHVPTDESMEAVAVLSGIGWPHKDIAKLLGITEKTLRKHYRDDIDRGALHLHAQLAGKAVAMALAGEKTMLIFVLKTRFGWRTTDREPAGDGTAAIAGDTDPEVADRGDPAP